MEYIIRTELIEDVVHALLVADGGNHRIGLYIGEVLGHHQADIVLRCLSLVNKHHAGRLVTCYLAHHLRADAACRAGDEYALATKLCTHRIHIDLDFRAGKQVLNADFLQLHALIVLIRELAILDAGLTGLLGHVYLTACTNEQVLYFLVVAELLHTQGADQNGIDVPLLDNIDQVFVSLIDPTAHQQDVLRLLLMRDEPLQDEAARSL